MRQYFRFRIIFFVLIIMFFALSLSAQNVDDKKFTFLENQNFNNPKLEYDLFKLIQVFKSSGLQKAEEYAKMRQIDFDINMVRVIVKTNSCVPDKTIFSVRAMPGVQQFIRELGGHIELIYNNSIQILLPISNIKQLLELNEVKYIRLPIKPHLYDTVSEGVEFSGADKFYNLSAFRSNRTVKVCILDSGFEGYENLLGSELPAKVTTKSFKQNSDITGGGVKHGTACAEIVHDMAPDAELYLVNYDSLSELQEAIDWLAEENVDIISFSMGYYNAGAGNGTGPVCELVEYAKSKGIIWVNSAGNDANTHWEDTFKDNNKNGFMDFGTDEIFEFSIQKGYPFWVFMNWNDWGTWDGENYSGSSNDYDLYLYIFDEANNKWVFVDDSKNLQTGSQWPEESFDGWYSPTCTKWGLKIKKKSNAKIKNIELFFDFNYTISGSMEYGPFANGSLTIPADSYQAIAVGAIPWEEGYKDYYYTYTSRGPTTDDRIKPDIAAASHVSNGTYASFGGTSASAPHVAGAIALYLNKTPFTLDQIRTILEKRAEDWGTPGKDNIFGFGKLKLD